MNHTWRFCCPLALGILVLKEEDQGYDVASLKLLWLSGNHSHHELVTSQAQIVQFQVQNTNSLVLSSSSWRILHFVSMMIKTVMVTMTDDNVNDDDVWQSLCPWRLWWWWWHRWWRWRQQWWQWCLVIIRIFFFLNIWFSYWYPSISISGKNKMSTTAVQANSSWTTLIYHEFQNEFAFSFYFCQVACPARSPFSYLFSSFEISCEIFVLYKQFWKSKKSVNDVRQ